jgi:hypothetical protein
LLYPKKSHKDKHQGVNKLGKNNNNLANIQYKKFTGDTDSLGTTKGNGVGGGFQSSNNNSYGNNNQGFGGQGGATKSGGGSGKKVVGNGGVFQPSNNNSYGNPYGNNNIKNNNNNKHPSSNQGAAQHNGVGSGVGFPPVSNPLYGNLTKVGGYNYKNNNNQGGNNNQGFGGQGGATKSGGGNGKKVVGNNGGGFPLGNSNPYGNNNIKNKVAKKNAIQKGLISSILDEIKKSSILDLIKKEDKPSKDQAGQNKISEKEKELAELRKTRDSLLAKENQNAQIARQTRILQAQMLEAQNRASDSEEREENTESIFLVVLLTLLTGGLYLIYRLLFGDKESNKERKFNRTPQVDQILAKNKTVEPEKELSVKPAQDKAEDFYKKQSADIKTGKVLAKEMQMQ